MSQDPTKTTQETGSGLVSGRDLNAEITQIAAAAVDVAEEIETVSGDDASLEDLERAKARAAEVLEKYTALFNRLAPEQAKKLKQEVGQAVQHIQQTIVQLKEAPE